MLTLTLAHLTQGGAVDAMIQFRCSNCFGHIGEHVVEQLQDGAKCFCNNCGKPLDNYTKYNPETRHHEVVTAGGRGEETEDASRAARSARR